jgi:agmatinase
MTDRRYTEPGAAGGDGAPTRPQAYHAGVSIDIDVVACAYAPGTGGVVLDGLEARQLFEAVSVFARHPVAALDLVEVAPNYDPAETTIRLAAQALFQFLVERAAAAGAR